MDRKSIIILVLSFILLMLWYPLVNKLYPPKPIPPEQLAAATNRISSGSTSTTAALPSSTNRIHDTPPLAAAAATGLPALQDQETTLAVETDVARYVFTSHGGGLKAVELKRYPETVGRMARRAKHRGDVATLNEGAPVPVLTLMGSDALLGDGSFALKREGMTVRAEKQLTNGLRVVKEFRLGTNYLSHARVRVENSSGEPKTLPSQEVVVGTATPISPYDNGLLMQVMWFDGRSAQNVADAWFANRTFGCFPGTPRSLYQQGNTNVYWASSQNQFFALIAIPSSNSPAHQVVVRRLDLPPPPASALEEDRQLIARPFGLQTAFLYPGTALAPGQALEWHYDLFAGPKEYRTLDQLGAQFGNRVDLVMNFGLFGFFAKALLLSMNGLYALGLSYGLAIIAITIIIKLLFWPLTQASTRSMKRMAALQPEMKKIQEKYKDDPKKMNEKTMQFMKEHRINPAAGCLPILIQIPVFFGFYTMLQSAIELRGASFLWAFDLSQPDTIFVIPGVGLPLNPLPLLMAMTQFWQMKMTPPSPGMDPVQQKIFQYMPLIFVFILYNFSSGLTLYWTVQNLLSIAQMKLTKSTGEDPAKAKLAAPPAVAEARKRRTPNRS
jgi:YidC/Oxa1 family membrane protein insertase